MAYWSESRKSSNLACQFKAHTILFDLSWKLHDRNVELNTMNEKMDSSNHRADHSDSLLRAGNAKSYDSYKCCLDKSNAELEQILDERTAGDYAALRFVSEQVPLVPG